MTVTCRFRIFRGAMEFLDWILGSFLLLYNLPYFYTVIVETSLLDPELLIV